MSGNDQINESVEAQTKIRKNFRFKIQKYIKPPFLNYYLFILALLTTGLAQGVWYSIAVITILFAHEMGHYLMCRRYGINATLPFFIPIPPPLNPFGTMGAVIRMEGKIPTRKALFDVGIAGPLAGLFFTIIALIIGLSLPSPVAEGNGEGIALGTPLLFNWMAKWLNPALISDPDSLIHPVAFAGWVGLFITSLNLLPIGQLDGGHVIYGILGPNSKYIYRIALIGFAINAAFYPPWVIFFILLLSFGFNHPPPLNDVEPLDRKRKILGALTFFVFFISFIPFPFHIF